MTDTANTTGTLREHHVPVDLTQPLVLEVHAPHGDVTVRAADRDDVLISQAAPGMSGDEVELVIDARDNRIEVRPGPRVGLDWSGPAGDIDLDAVFGEITRAFRRGGPWAAAKAGVARVAGATAWAGITIEIPRAISGRFALHTASGDLRIEGITGEIELNTMSGDVRVIRASGDLTLQTASGDLAIEDGSGRLAVRSASGDVRVASSRIAAFQIQTANGDIALDAVLAGDGPFRAQSASGDVRLTARGPASDAEEAAATLAFQTISGDAHVTPPFRKIDRRRWQAGSGSGGPHIEITTVSGDLAAGFAPVDSAAAPAAKPASRAEAMPPAPPAPPAPSSPPEPASPSEGWRGAEVDTAAIDDRPEMAPSAAPDDAERLAVLEAVERGEIDVEEALRRLEGTDSVTGP